MVADAGSRNQSKRALVGGLGYGAVRAEMNIHFSGLEGLYNLLCGFFPGLRSAWIVFSRGCPFQKLNREIFKNMMRRDIQTTFDIRSQRECTAECSAQMRCNV
jgi:hypothetical protein